MDQMLESDYFVVEDGKSFAGKHLIIDMWEAQDLDNIEKLEKLIRKAISISKATLLHIHLHQFSSSGGISGVAVLAESHLSVHTWPEKGFVAFDVFMCGKTSPEKTIEVLANGLKAKSVKTKLIRRGENL
tara:strand:- start:801 stop:1190 length:390 start_codon:yes stop_codon:yes gene_type:complete